MKYYSYRASDRSKSEGFFIDTVSEREIISTYWPSWYADMCDRYEAAYIDENYTVQDCIDDWVYLHRAWLSTP